jgi:gliding motility-associated-like protein
MFKNILYFVFFISLSVYSNNIKAQGGLWAHMGGSLGSGAMGLYGTKGVADPTNMPSGRYQGAFWTDLQGNFWLFGGFLPFGYGNDLWKFDLLLNQWTWINGPQYVTDQNGEFGTKGVPSPLNYPPARTFGPNCWTDKNGDLWLYGGFGFDKNNNQGGLSDLWRYKISTNEWTWMSGADIVNSIPVYGTVGIPSATNSPGARAECKSGWVDDNNNLWMYGGQDGATAQVTVNVRSDMWRYNISTNEWTWIKGPNTMNSGANWGVKGVETSTNNPASRLSFTKWKGKDNNFYVFAGGNSGSARNDLWRFNPSNSNWTWISGSNTLNHLGTYNGKCLPDSLAYPKARIENQTVATSTCTEVFWSFGGFKTLTNTESFNDLWLYNLTTNKWTWVSGGTATNVTNISAPIGVGLPTNRIGSRGGVYIWSDAQNNLWVFGGLAYDSTISALGLKNDLWRFQPDSTCFDAGFSSVLILEGPDKLQLCPGDTTSMHVPPNTNLTITPNTDYIYSLDSTQLIFSPLTTTTYTITGAEKGICAGLDTIVFTIEIIPLPIADFTLSPLSAFISDPIFTLSNTSTLSTTYEWIYKNTNTSFSTNQDASYSVTDSGTHCFILIAKNQLGCADTAEHCGIKLMPDNIFIPSVFSPNNDDKNNTFRVLGSYIKLMKFIVYNRWGERVFSTTDISKGWDGKHKGTDAEIGTYYYYVEYEAYGVKKTLKGDINLIR